MKILASRHLSVYIPIIHVSLIPMHLLILLMSSEGGYSSKPFSITDRKCTGFATIKSKIQTPFNGVTPSTTKHTDITCLLNLS